MKFNNPFTVLDETNSHTLIVCIVFLLITCFVALITLMLIAPLPTIGFLTVVALCRVVYAVFKGK
jgi:hypothetical protein